MQASNKDKRLITAMLFVLQFLSAQAMPQSHLYTRLTVEDGLRSNYVNAVYQDHKGFMWVGTDGGLQRYDGRQFEYFPFTGIPGIAQEEAKFIFETRNNLLWVMYNTCAVTYDYIKQEARRVPLAGYENTSVSATQFFQDSKGRIWLCTAGHGAYLLDEKARAFVPFSRLFSNCHGFRVNSMAEDPLTRQFWLGTDIGLCLLDFPQRTCYTARYNPHHIPALNIPELQKNISRLFGDSRHGLFINTWAYQAEHPDFHHYNLLTGKLSGDLLHIGALTYMMEDQQGNVWSAGDKLWRFSGNGQTAQEFARDQFARYGLDYTDMFCLEEDNMQNMWIGTSNGIFIFNYNKQQFRTTPFKPSTDGRPGPLLEATDTWQHPNGDVWVASWGQGLLVYDSTLTRLKKQIKHPSDFKCNMLWCIQPLPDGRVVIGAQHAHLLFVDPRTWKVEYRKLDELDNRTIRSIALDADGNLWLGTQWGILAKWDYRRKIIRTWTDSLYKNGRYQWQHIQDIYPDKHRNIWVGTAGHGLLKMDTAGRILQRFATNEPGHALPGNNIRNISPMGADKLLIAGGGISLLNTVTGKVLNTITEDHGLPVHTVTNVLPVNNQTVFFTTNFSAGKVNLANRKVVHYGRNYGVADETFQLPTACRLRSGHVVFGSTKSILTFYPDSLREPERPPDVRIHFFKTGEDLQSPYSPMVADGIPNMVLHHKNGTFTIGYTSLAYLEQDNLTYYYRLEGIDRQWVKANKRQYVTYSNLSPGTYTFHVYCENGEGLATRNITSMTINIQKPVWQKGWFYAVLALLIGGVIYVIHRLRVNRLLATEKVRRRIARDLHDDMGSTLTSINIMSSMARRNAVQQDLAKTQDFLVKIGESTTRMMESMDDIVWSINPLNDSTPRVIARMREFTTSMLEARQIGFTFSIDEKIYSRRLKLESRHDFFMIYKETITNIAKYARCTFVDIRIQLRKGQLVLRVQDDGVGFNVNEAGEGDGLMNMQRRAYRMNGQLSIQSQIGKGTVITLMFPTT
ncbi:sensor histidine kinase [Chitinophaga sp. 22620]|uniref:sensor histidine kinase n=1 Tax=Chitinophaga sp. 22620 TaxID=3453952 RepID=UPI003F85E08F